MIRQAKFGVKFWVVREVAIVDLKEFNFSLSLNSINLINFTINLPHLSH